MSAAVDPSPAVVAANRRAASSAAAAFHEHCPGDLDHRDEADADRGFVAAREPGVVTTADGTVVWDSDSYSFVREPCPPSVHPMLWRHAGLTGRQGLFRVAEGIYQVRGLDLSNMTLVEGHCGVVVIDALMSVETAAAALALYREHRGDRPVTGLIYTHSRIDHFGGGPGVVTEDEVLAGRCPVLAPIGFRTHAPAVSGYAGTAAARRAAYGYGVVLPRGPLGSVGAGLGQTTSLGTVGLLPPTVEIATTGHREVLDGVPLVFQIVSGAGGPAAMNIHLPGHRVLYLAESLDHPLTDLPPSGAHSDAPKERARRLTETINRFATSSDVLLAAHLGPIWGADRVAETLSLYRDLYGYLHDQTVRLLDLGYVGAEIAERLELPPALEHLGPGRGGSAAFGHHVKAIHQHYLGWFDGNPAHLWEHPPVEAARRHVEFMGGAEEVLRKARESYEAGDYRWVAQVAGYVVFADPADEEARHLQASAFEQLAYGSAEATRRNIYLSGAYELRYGIFGTPTAAGSPVAPITMSVEQILDSVALRVDGPKAWDQHLVTDWQIIDTDRIHRVELRNGVLTHYERPADRALPDADATFTLSRAALVRVLLAGEDFGVVVGAGEIAIDGDPTKLASLVAVLDTPDPNFAIVTP
ncbi:alkyl/aryl-sulfatase [Nocardia shimofusensis]|uniref:alkyl/aryl-sulfatase n=1 Tax=Nocardia shimofusensis TaxID=228596 RepID=UPI00082B8DF1